MLRPLNRTNPDLVVAIHRAYVAAGAQVIQTNTFGANRFKLAAHDLGDQVAAINRGGRRAGSAGGEKRFYI